MIDIPYVYTEGAKVNVLLNEQGRPNWAIWRFKKENDEKVDTLNVHEKASKPIELNIRETTIKDDPVFYYNNKKLKNTINATAREGYLLGRIAIDYKKLDADSMIFLDVDYNMNFKHTGLNIDANNSDLYILKKDSSDWRHLYVDITGKLNKLLIKNKRYISDSKIELLGNLIIDQKYSDFVFREFNVDFNNSFFNLTGSIKPSNKGVLVSAEIGFASKDIRSLVKKFPGINWKFLNKVKYDLPIKLDVSIAGEYSSKKDIMPNLSSEIKISNASFTYNELPEIKDIFLDAYRTEIRGFIS